MVAPAVGLKVTPVQPAPVVLATGGLATSNPDGNVSVNVTFVSASYPGCVLVMVKVSVDVAFTGIGEGENTLLSAGGGV